MTMEQGDQILKARDDHAPILMKHDAGLTKPLLLSPDIKCSWAQADERFGPEKLRSRIEPWLTALVQSEHLSLLIGSGLTHAVHGISGSGTLPGMDLGTFEVLGDEISAEANRVAQAAQRGNGNFEDQLRAAFELLRGLEIISPTRADGTTADGRTPALREAIKSNLASFAASILTGERNLALADYDKREEAFRYLVNLLMSFSSRTGTRDRLHIFTTNYDRYIEAGADVAGLRMIDRFVGTLAPVFRASRLDVDLHYNPPGIRGEPRYLEGVARFTKLHGAIDWVDSGGAIRRIGLPFGAAEMKPYLTAPGLDNIDEFEIMIYPNAAKDRETMAYPYVELFRDFAAAICRPNSTLVCYGYSFGDEHLNRIIEDMLTIPSTHLVVIAYGDSLDRIMHTYEKVGRPAQVTLMIGDHLGDLKTLVDHYLPKPAIDRTTIRMADLLKARWGPGKDSGNTTNGEGTDDTSNANPVETKGLES